MRIALYQLDSSKGILKNKQCIIKALRQGAEKGAALIVFQECALCGYPFVEIPNVAAVSFDAIEAALREIKEEAKKSGICVALGTLRRDGKSIYNSMVLLSPDGETLGYYDKTALWGWDRDNYTAGTNNGIFTIAGIKIGFRICFDVRFPELFRDFYKRGVSLCFVSFCDVSEEENPDRFSLIEGHLRTRAAENVMTVASVNSVSAYQTAPTAVYDPNGSKMVSSSSNRKSIMIFDYQTPALDFGMKGRKCVSDELIG